MIGPPNRIPPNAEKYISYMQFLSVTIAGLGAGAMYAVIAVCLVLMTRLIRVINFAQVAVGVYAAFCAIRLQPLGWPDWSIAAFAIVLGAIVSLVIGFVVAFWLSNSSSGAKSAVTTLALLGLMSLSYLQFGTQPQAVRPIFQGPSFSIGGATVTNLSIALLVLAVCVSAVATSVLNLTPVGLRLRALADRPGTAELIGINTMGLQLGLWAVTGAVMTTAIMFAGNSQAPQASVDISLIIPGAAAALAAGFKRFSIAIIAGLLLGAVQGL